MKISTYLEIDIETGAILRRDCFEYSGPVALCKGGGTTVVPMSDEEKALLNTQNQILQKQMGAYDDYISLQNELEPFTLESMNLKRDERGNIVKIQEKTADEIMAEKNLALMGYDTAGNKLTTDQMLGYMTDAEKQEYNITQAANDRLAKAYAGELDISPALERELSTQQSQLEETLARKLGPSWQQSTAGQNALRNFQESAGLIREEARRGLISSQEGINAARSNTESQGYADNSNIASLLSGIQSDKLSRMMGVLGQRKADSGFDMATSMSSQYASDRANRQNALNANRKSGSDWLGTMAGLGSAAMIAF